MPTRNEIREIQKAHELFMRAVAPFFEDKAGEKGGILETKGLLREIGSQEIIARIINTGKFENSIDAHTRATLLKECIKNILPLLSQIAPEEIKKLQDAYKNASNDSEKEEALKNFISVLANSNNLEKIKIAEMLYTYIRLGKEISKHRDTNSMGTSNVSSILGGSFEQIFYREHGIDHLTQIENAGNTLKKTLQGDHFNKPFSEVYFSETYASAAEDALLSEAKKVVRSRRTSIMAKRINRELLNLRKEGKTVNFITAALNIYSEYQGNDKEGYKQRILKLCSPELAKEVQVAFTKHDTAQNQTEQPQTAASEDKKALTFLSDLKKRVHRVQKSFQNLTKSKDDSRKSPGP